MILNYLHCIICVISCTYNQQFDDKSRRRKATKSKSCSQDCIVIRARGLKIPVFQLDNLWKSLRPFLVSAFFDTNEACLMFYSVLGWVYFSRTLSTNAEYIFCIARSLVVLSSNLTTVFSSRARFSDKRQRLVSILCFQSYREIDFFEMKER